MHRGGEWRDECACQWCAECGTLSALARCTAVSVLQSAHKITLAQPIDLTPYFAKIIRPPNGVRPRLCTGVESGEMSVLARNVPNVAR